MHGANRYLRLGAEAKKAQETGQPVVALESTIISHGMPYPRNIETAREVETVVRDAGAVPATVAVIGGEMVAGLSDGELEFLAKSDAVIKAGRRELALALATRQVAATTVAATMIVAAAAGIRVFATGGTGGVHRGVESTMDVSGDLVELSRSEVAVVSAGVKSILDIPRTLEYLETLGVPVYGYATDEFPAFYTRYTGLPVSARVADAREAAELIHAQWTAGFGGGALVANPIPTSAEMEHGYIEGIIEQAVSEVSSKGIRGQEVTPYLLARIVELTGGRSLEANIALVKNNAAVAAKIAGELQRLQAVES